MLSTDKTLQECEYKTTYNEIKDELLQKQLEEENKINLKTSIIKRMKEHIMTKDNKRKYMFRCFMVLILLLVNVLLFSGNYISYTTFFIINIIILIMFIVLLLMYLGFFKKQ